MHMPVKKLDAALASEYPPLRCQLPAPYVPAASGGDTQVRNHVGCAEVVALVLIATVTGPVEVPIVPFITRGVLAPGTVCAEVRLDCSVVGRVPATLEFASCR